MSSAKPLYLQALEALRNREALFRVFIFTMVTVGFWIGFGIFFSQQKTKVEIDTQKHTTPLNPNINQSALQELAGRKVYSDQELETFPIYDRVISEDKISRVIISGSEVDETDLTFTEIPADLFSTGTPSATPATTEEPTPTISPETTPEASSSGTP